MVQVELNNMNIHVNIGYITAVKSYEQKKNTATSGKLIKQHTRGSQ